MVRKKSSISKVKTRKYAYNRRSMRSRVHRSWRVLFFVLIATRKFLKNRHSVSLQTRTSSASVLDRVCSIEFSCSNIDDVDSLAAHTIDAENDVKRSKIVKDIVKDVVSRVCRLDSERKRQLQIRKRNYSSEAAAYKEAVSKRHRQSIWLRRKYSESTLFRRKQIAYVANKSRANYENNSDFRQRKMNKSKSHELIKYQTDAVFRGAKKKQSKKDSSDKYHSNEDFRLIRRDQSKRRGLDKYQTDEGFRCEKKNKSRKCGSDKYHNDWKFRNAHKDRARIRVIKKYRSDNDIRFKMIEYAKKYYKDRSSPMKRQERRLYDQSRRISKKYKLFQNRACAIKHRDLYLNNLNQFRRVIAEGPDCICIVCRVAFFRNQVIPFEKEKYILTAIPDDIRESLQFYLNDSFTMSKQWICRLCSEKIKKKQIPSRAYANNLKVSEIPPELKKLNTLEKHLIALRLPFMKIVNLTSGKVSSRFAQKGTKGPLHCVPSDVQDTVTTLPRPIDKSMMVRLQLKRRLNYKAVWEEQFINPKDVRDALIVLTKIHPSYKHIEVTEIDENYLLSDKERGAKNEVQTEVESMNVDNVTNENIIETTEDETSEHLKRLALGDVVSISADNDDEGLVEDNRDIRTKYNIGTDSCAQPCDFNHFLVFDKNPHAVAPAEKNKLCSLLTDRTIEALAFPHLFPDGQGSYDEERQTILHWKEYCKVRLFSSDPRFGADSSYIFFLQYLGDLKQVFSSINVAFRKKVPMNAKQCLDESQIKFLLNKDMIYRHLQCIRGSPQFWNQRLKQLFGMSRQLDFNHLFLTFSCADLRWKEFIDAFVQYTGGEIKETYTYEEKTNLLRACPVVAARMFERRFNTFMNLFIKGGAYCLGKVTDWFIRIEMQLRGSPHAHMPIWVENAPKYKGTRTDQKTREEIVKFCDQYITTRFPNLEEDAELYHTIKEVQTHSRNHSKSCLKYRNTLCHYGFPRPVSRRTFICEPLKDDDSDNRQSHRKTKEILTELNISLNALETQKTLTWTDFDNLLLKYKWTYEDYERALRIAHTRPIIIHKREPNARWINQYNEELLRAWNANMDIQFVLDPYACAKYIMSYTTKPEREMSLLLEATHKECRDGNMSVREEMKKLTGTFFNHRQVSVQESIYRATKMPLSYCSRGFVFVPAHSNSCRFLKPTNVLKQMQPEDENIYMSNLADKYFDRPADVEFDICMADFASEYEIRSVNRNVKSPRTAIKRLQTLNFTVKKRCGRKAIIRFPFFNRQVDRENYYENLLCLYLPIRSRDELRKPYELFFQAGEVFDKRHECMRKVKDIVQENQRKYETHFKETEEVESILHELSKDAREDDWAAVVAKKGTNDVWSKEIEEEDNPDFNQMYNKKSKGTFIDLKQNCMSTDEIRPLLDSMNEEQQEVFYRVRQWCTDRLHNPDTEPLRLFITGGAGTGKSHLLKCLHYEATKIFSRKKHLEPDENIDEIHTLITAFTGAAAVNVGGVTIHSAFGIASQQQNLNESLSSEKLNTYRCKLGTLKLLFVDEVSLIQADLWGAMHSRLTQIMGIYSNSIVFGNVGIIALGDFYQCSPVASSGIYSSLLWTDHFESVELTVNERQKTNKSFSQMLNRIRKLKRKEQLNEEDRLTLQKCHQRYLNKEYHPEALHLFAKNAQVDVHNEMMIEKICTDIRTFNECDRNDKEIKSDENTNTRKAGSTLRLAKHARVMITKNISVNDGLANGVLGRIVNFVENEKNEVSRIIIKCDSPRVGRLHRLSCQYCQTQNTVCVARESNTTDRFDFDSESKKGCKQFPLRLSWAMTIHKAQGITVDEIVVSTKDLFSSGMGYTALSRVRTLEGLFLIDFHPDKFYCHEKVDRVLSQMKEMKKEPSTFQDSSEFLNVLFHNVEGLRCNFNALRNHRCTQKANLICVVETWLRDDSPLDELQIDGYYLFQKTRSSSFESTHPLQKQKGGGVAIYVQETLSLKESRFDEEPNLEYLRFDIKNNNVTIITCYRSSQQRKKEFIEKVEKVLKQLTTERKILLIGDFNEDTLDNKERSIERKLEELGFVNIYKGISTTNSLSSLDCVYANFVINKATKKQVTGTYFSFHDALTFCVNLLDGDLLTDKDIQNNDDTRVNVDKLIENSSAAIEVSRLTNKRKHQSKERISAKVLKSTTVASPAHTNDIPDLKRKQLLFLENHKDIRQKNCQQSSSRRLQFSEQLAAIALKKKNVLGDGNCFFRAISYQLHRHENEHFNIRSAMINYLVDNMTEFAPYVEDHYANPDDYIDQMSRSGTYADHLAVLATAIIIKKNIIVHEIHHRPLLIPGSDFIDHQAHVCYHAENQHYDTTISLNGNLAYVPPEDMLFT